MSEGRISTDLPFIKKQAVEALRVDYPDRDTAAQKNCTQTSTSFTAHLSGRVSRQARAVDAAVKQCRRFICGTFSRNESHWGTYANNLGHMDSPGCFRCHDGSHTAADGRTIPNDCDTCHTLLAVDEAESESPGGSGEEVTAGVRSAPCRQIA